MGLEYIKLPEPDAGHVIAVARLCLTDDLSRLVPDTDPDARWLFCVPGAPIARADAERYGLLTEPESEAETPKRGRRPADKSRTPEGDK